MATPGETSVSRRLLALTQGPVRQVVTRHRAWFHADRHAMLAGAGREEVDSKAAALAMLRDSLLISTFLDDRQEARQTFVRTARWLAGLP